jgi:hypothetical protein
MIICCKITALSNSELFIGKLVSNFMKTATMKINKGNLMIIHCLTPLLIGGLLYILFRSTDIRMFKWFSIIGLDNLIYLLREVFFQFKNDLPCWTYYSLPDGLWVYAFTSSLLILWNGRLTFWLSLPLLTGTFVEIAQGLKIFPGTFDILDLFFTTIALLSSTIIIIYKFNQNEKTIS